MKRLLLLTAMLLMCLGVALALQTNNAGTSGTQNQTTTTTTSGGNQNAAPAAGAQSGTQDQTGAAATPSDQGAAAGQSNATGNKAKAGGRLPQTASPLPLLGLLGAGSLAAGVVTRRRKK